MRDKKIESSFGARYMSPLVKQDLARLDKDGESRRSAMNSLKQFVEHLEPGSMPRFLAQVSETRDQGPSRPYAISLYEEVARVHGKLVIPHIPRVMGTVTRSLSSSGSSPQLHQACAKVVSAVARYSIDGGTPAEEADLILRQICHPLLDVLAGKLEPLAAGAAVCLQALVECDKWKFASDEIIHEACSRTTVALGERTTRTIAHMQLARSLASTNPSFFSSLGVTLLRTGSEVLRQNPSGTWQQRACAARLLQAVLPSVDSATLASELEHTVQALGDCRHDRMAHVRTAVSDALKTAKILSSDEKSLHTCDSEDPLVGISLLSSSAIDDDQPKKPRSETDYSPRRAEDLLQTDYNKHGYPTVAFSEECMTHSFFSNASPRSLISAEASPSHGNRRRSPPFQTSLPSEVCSSRTSSVMSVEDLDALLNPGRTSEAQAKENVPSRNPDVNAGVPFALSGGTRSSDHAMSAVPGFKLPHSPSSGDKIETDPRLSDLGQSPSSPKLAGRPNRRGGKSFNSLENSVMTGDRAQDGVDLVDDEDFPMNATTADVDVEPERVAKYGNLLSEQSVDNEAGNRSGSQFTRRVSETERILGNLTSTKPIELERRALQRMSQTVGAHSLEDCTRTHPGASDIRNDGNEPSKSTPDRDSAYEVLPRMQSFEDFSNLQVAGQKPRALITAEDFLPFSTPRRLVRSLQSNVSTSPATSSGRVQGIKLEQGGADLPDMDLETCSEAGWSVRDNPMASDDSFKADSELEEQGGKTCKQMTIDSCSCIPSEPVKKDNRFTEECDRISLALLHVAESLLCVNTSRSLEPECLKEDVTTENFSVPPPHPQGSLEISASEDDLSECFCDDVDDVAFSKKEVVEYGAEHLGISEENDGKLLSLEQAGGRALGVFLIRFHNSLGDVLLKSFRSLWSCAEAFLWGFLLVVLVFPLAMMLSRLLWSPFDQLELIPT